MFLMIFLMALVVNQLLSLLFADDTQLNTYRLILSLFLNICDILKLGKNDKLIFQMSAHRQNPSFLRHV